MSFTTREQIIAALKEAGFDVWVESVGPLPSWIERFYTIAFEAGRAALRQQLAAFHSAAEHVTEDGCTRRSAVAMPEGWAMVHKDRLHDLELAEEQLAEAQTQSARRLEGLCKCGVEKDQLHEQVTLLRKGFTDILTDTCEKFPGQRMLQIMGICHEALTATARRVGNGPQRQAARS